VGPTSSAEIQWDGFKWFVDFDSNAANVMLIWGLVDTLNYNKANSVLKWSDDFNVEDTLSVDIVVPSDSGGITFGDSVNFVDNLVGSGEGKYIHWDGDELLLGCDKIGSSQIIGFSLKDSAIYDTVTKRLSFTGKLEVEDTLFTDIIMPNDSTSLIIGSSGGLAADSITSNNWIQHNGIRVFAYVDADIDDTEEYELTVADGKAGWGMASCEDEWTFFRFTAAGAVTLVEESANVSTTDGTDASFNIFDSGTTITFENQLGDNQELNINVWFVP